MHLLVLSAFRQDGQWYSAFLLMSLNAPFGAQCFPTWDRDDVVVAHDVSQCTFWCSVLSDEEKPASEPKHLGLNAPFGAQCFPTAY